MAKTPGTLEQIAIRIGRVLTRLTARLDGEEIQETLARLGLVLPATIDQLSESTYCRVRHASGDHRFGAQWVPGDRTPI